MRRKDDTEEGDHLTSLVFFLSREERRPNPSKCTTHTHAHTHSRCNAWHYL